jgi:hypothetical protein
MRRLQHPRSDGVDESYGKRAAGGLGQPIDLKIQRIGVKSAARRIAGKARFSAISYSTG